MPTDGASRRFRDRSRRQQRHQRRTEFGPARRIVSLKMRARFTKILRYGPTPATLETKVRGLRWRVVGGQWHRWAVCGGGPDQGTATGRAHRVTRMPLPSFLASMCVCRSVASAVVYSPGLTLRREHTGAQSMVKSACGGRAATRSALVGTRGGDNVNSSTTASVSKSEGRRHALSSSLHRITAGNLSSSGSRTLRTRARGSVEWQSGRPASSQAQAGRLVQSRKRSESCSLQEWLEL